MLYDMRRRPYSPARERPVPQTTHYLLGFSLAAAAAVFTLLHHFVMP